MEDATYVTHDNDHLHTSKITIDSWLADSATLSHICNNKNAFVQFTPAHTHVKGVGGVFVSAEGRGTVHLISQINKNKIQIVLSNVLYVPSAPNNLFSVTRLDELEGCAIMGNSFIRLYDKNELLIAIGKKKDRLYLLDAKAQPVEIKETALYTWADWHRRFRHVGISGLKRMHAEKLVDSFEVDENSPLPDCNPCIQPISKPWKIP